MAFRSDLDAVVLAALADGPLHGYAIVRRLRQNSDGMLKLGEGQLYPTLHRLERSGMVTATWHPQEGRPSRRVYELTELGRRELARARKDWERFVKSISAVLRVG